MTNLSGSIKKLKNISGKKLLVYIVLYFVFGMFMNALGTHLEIAKFTYWWQVITCYVFYMIPVSIALNGYHFFTQYAYGLVAMGFLEFAGYTLGTSYVFPNNILEQWFGPYTFALGMAIFFAVYFPLGNWAVNLIHDKFLTKNVVKNLQK
jgi:hypothetical protein